MAEQYKKNHYVPKFYLAGFTDNNTDTGVLQVFDLASGQQRESVPKQEGYENNLHDIDADGLDPKLFEHMFREIEGHAAGLFRTIAASATLPTSDEELGCLLVFIAAQAARLPRVRRGQERFHDDVMQHMLDIVTHDDHRFQATIQRLKDAGVEMEPVT